MAVPLAQEETPATTTAESEAQASATEEVAVQQTGQERFAEVLQTLSSSGFDLGANNPIMMFVQVLAGIFLGQGLNDLTSAFGLSASNNTIDTQAELKQALSDYHPHLEKMIGNGDLEGAIRVFQVAEAFEANGHLTAAQIDRLEAQTSFGDEPGPLTQNDFDTIIKAIKEDGTYDPNAEYKIINGKFHTYTAEGIKAMEIYEKQANHPDGLHPEMAEHLQKLGTEVRAEIEEAEQTLAEIDSGRAKIDYGRAEMAGYAVSTSEAVPGTTTPPVSEASQTVKGIDSAVTQENPQLGFENSSAFRMGANI